jgi:DNA polymerase III gamma/tau subunit
MDAATLTAKYRPRDLNDVAGQTAACHALFTALSTGSSHAFLLSGPKGTGKTTLARIGAAMLNADITEIDGATFTGIDDMRTVQDTLHYAPLAGEARAIILDEAHRLSKPAWDSLLKVIEEPPDYVYWFLSTTEPTKLPATIRDRCTELRLSALATDELIRLLARVEEAEGWTTEPQIVALCAREAEGSARKALVNLASVQGFDFTRARDLLLSRTEPKPVADLCKLLMGGRGTWLQAMSILANINDDPESTRIMISNYLAAVIRKAKTDNDAKFLLFVLDQFSQPYHSGEKQAPLMLSIGRVLYAG